MVPQELKATPKVIRTSLQPHTNRKVEYHGGLGAKYSEMASRLAKEWQEIEREARKAGGSGEQDIVLLPNEENIFQWSAYLKGPPGTPFEGGTFELEVKVPRGYPLQPPNIRYITKIFHPNIHFKTGEICLDILKTAWSPAWTLQSVCRAIIALMSHPEPDSPLNCDGGNLLRYGDLRGFESLAKMYTKTCATATAPKKQ